MSKGRMISSEIWEDDYFIELSLLERMIWIGLLTCSADDQGRMQDNSRLIHSQLFPVDDLDDNLIENALEKFSNSGKIIRYISDGRRIIQIKNWWKYQAPRWAGKSKYKPPKGWIDRERYHGIGNVVLELNWKEPGGFQEHSTASNTINDVDGDVNGDVDVKVDVDVDVDISPSGDNDNDDDLISEFESISGLTRDARHNQEWITDLKHMRDNGVTPQIMRRAIQELRDKNYKVSSPHSILRAVEMVQGDDSIRIPDSTGIYAEYIQH